MAVVGAFVSARREPAAFRLNHAFDQGSNIAIDRLSLDQVRRLALLGKVWGFVKYHHPHVTQGRLHWDYELLRILPRVLDARDFEAARTVVLGFVDALPLPAEGAPSAKSPTDPHPAPEIAWIHDRSLLGADLSARLELIYRHRRVSGRQFYVSLVRPVKNPRFENELPYGQFKTPDAGFRILALFRYWNIIRYWFPYRDEIGEDWDAVLAEFLPRLVAAGTADAYRLEMMALIARVHDTHASLWSSLDLRPPRGARLVPVVVRFIEGVPVVTGYSHAEGKRSGLEIGDIMLAIDGIQIESLIHEWRPCYGASNEAALRRDIARVLTRGDEPSCRLRIQRDTQPPIEIVTERLPLQAIDFRTGFAHDLPGDAFRLLSPDVAYLKLSQVKAHDAAKYIKEGAGTRGLVIDIRDYPSEFIVFSLGAYLVRQATPFARFTKGDLGNPGAFLWTEALIQQPKSPHYPGKVVILVDEVSQSQAEYTAMAFRVAPGAVVIGSTTAGADGNYSAITLPGGLRTGISGIGVFYPDKRPTQRVGIVPDVKAEPTIAGVRKGRDEVLEAAVRHILGPDVPIEEILRLTKKER
jgi:hypothetical protein